MARPEILKHSVRIDEEEVFRLIGSTCELPQIQPSFFGGRVALWAEERERRGDSVNELVTYMGNGHRTSFVSHEGFDETSGGEFCVYHLACDCALGYVDENSPGKLVEKVIQCTNTQRALLMRAALVNRTYRTREILNALRDTEVGDFEQPSSFHRFAVKTIGVVLELDALHPEEWPATVISGQHQVSILSIMLQLHPEVVRWYGRILEDEGVIDFDGETMRLTVDNYQEMIDALEDC